MQWLNVAVSLAQYELLVIEGTFALSHGAPVWVLSKMAKAPTTAMRAMSLLPGSTMDNGDRWKGAYSSWSPLPIN